MRTIFVFAAAVIGAIAVPALAQQATPVDPARALGVLKAGFPKAPADWENRLLQDETMKACSAQNNLPSKALADAIVAREKSSIQYPADGNLIGDWKKGEKLAQSGYGLRFTDYPARGDNGGNCYACHQLTKQEISYGTIGPNLLEYGKIRKFSEADTKAAYEKIYNAHAAFPCSLMPRFGTNNILTIEQIRDIVALLMSPDSPVNK